MSTILTDARSSLRLTYILRAANRVDIPLPEMTFGNNALNLTFSPSGSSPVSLSFEALSALEAVAVGDGWEENVGGGVQVSMAEHWGQNRLVDP